jgi:hypothetical protein
VRDVDTHDYRYESENEQLDTERCGSTMSALSVTTDNGWTLNLDTPPQQDVAELKGGGYSLCTAREDMRSTSKRLIRRS